MKRDDLASRGEATVTSEDHDDGFYLLGALVKWLAIAVAVITILTLFVQACDY